MKSLAGNLSVKPVFNSRKWLTKCCNRRAEMKGFNLHCHCHSPLQGSDIFETSNLLKVLPNFFFSFLFVLKCRQFVLIVRLIGSVFWVLEWYQISDISHQSRAVRSISWSTETSLAPRVKTKLVRTPTKLMTRCWEKLI